MYCLNAHYWTVEKDAVAVSILRQTWMKRKGTHFLTVRYSGQGNQKEFRQFPKANQAIFPFKSQLCVLRSISLCHLLMHQISCHFASQL